MASPVCAMCLPVKYAVHICIQMCKLCGASNLEREGRWGVQRNGVSFEKCNFRNRHVFICSVICYRSHRSRCVVESVFRKSILNNNNSHISENTRNETKLRFCGVELGIWIIVIEQTSDTISLTFHLSPLFICSIPSVIAKILLFEMRRTWIGLAHWVAWMNEWVRFEIPLECRLSSEHICINEPHVYWMWHVKRCNCRTWTYGPR